MKFKVGDKVMFCRGRKPIVLGGRHGPRYATGTVIEIRDLSFQFPIVVASSPSGASGIYEEDELELFQDGLDKAIRKLK